MRYHNPVIPGFHPDPSITRKKEDFYLVTSSFEYFPGVPVFHSRNLVNWEQVGYCLTNERQLDLRGIRASKGIYAPTIRYYEGLFYMITTITDGQGGRKNIIVHAEDPAGVWSDPAVVDWKGIDPSLFWDDDGKCYFTGTGTLCKKRIMACFEIDPMTGERLGEVRDIGLGSGGPAPEAPHIFKKDGYYYYMLAEGGTEYGHSETIHRASSIFGPYEPCPRNPILSHFNRKGHEIQGVGHADLIEDQNGRWWAVFLGFRNYSGAPLHNIGRETFLMPVFWNADGWPVIGERGYAELDVDADLPEACRRQTADFHADFKKETLDVRFFHTRNPDPLDYRPDPERGMLVLTGHEVTLETNESSPTMISVVQPAFMTEFRASFDLDLTHAEKAGITAYLSNDYHYDLYLSERDGRVFAGFSKAVHDIKAKFVQKPLEEIMTRDCADRTVTLTIRTDRRGYSFFIRTGEKETYIGFGSNAGLSTEQTMERSFTGTVFSAFCINGTAALTSFDVEVLPDSTLQDVPGPV